jgi:hypothetical protein
MSRDVYADAARMRNAIMWPVLVFGLSIILSIWTVFFLSEWLGVIGSFFSGAFFVVSLKNLIRRKS